MSAHWWRWAASGVRIAVAGMLVAPFAPAEPMTDTTVLVLGAEDTPLTARLRAEIRALGLRVVVLEGADASLAELEVRARATGASVALSATESSEGVELRLVDRVTGKTLLREVLQRDLSITDPDALIALRAVELLRASLLELELRHPPRGEVALTHSQRETIRRSLGPRERAEPSRSSSSAENAFQEGVFASSGLALLAHPGETRLQSGVAAALSWQPTAALAVGVWAVVPFSAVNVSAVEGAADVRSNVFGSGLRFMPFPLDARWAPTFGAGASVLWSSVDGTRARSDLVLASEELITVGPYAEIGCGLAIVRGLTLRSDFRTVVAFPKPIIRFAEREVASLGRPFMTATFALEYRAVVGETRD